MHAFDMHQAAVVLVGTCTAVVLHAACLRCVAADFCS